MPNLSADDRVSTTNDSALTTASSSSSNLFELTIQEAQALMESGDLTAVELTQYYLDRIAAYDDTGPGLNSVVALNPDLTRLAQQLDLLRTDGIVLGPLHGIPIIVKDSYNLAGLPTTGGVKGFEDFIPDEDAFVVEKLREAGAIIIGKANMDTFASGIDGFSNLFGDTKNPYNITKETGGSSSGTGAAVAANFAIAGMGGETGGSIRIPSDANALVGIKPSRGLISVNGTIPLVPYLDVIGPMTRTVTDAAIMMDVLVQYDPENIWNPYTPSDSTLRPISYASPEVLSDTALEGKLLAVPKAYIGEDQSLDFGLPFDPEVKQLFEQAVEILEEQGAEVIEVDTASYYSKYVNFDEQWDLGWPDGESPSSASFPETWFQEHTAYYLEAFIKNLGTEKVKSLLDVADAVTGKDADNYLPGVVDAVESGTLRSLSGKALEIVLNAVEAYREEYEGFVAERGIDALVFPTLNIPAPTDTGPTTEESDDWEDAYLHANAEGNDMGLPSINLPMGFTTEDVPVSIEFLGDYYNEAEIIGFAYDYEQATLYRKSPGFTPDLSIEIGTALQSGIEGELIDLRPQVGKTVEATFSVSESAAIDNVVGFYAVQGESGAVIDPLTGEEFKPGDAGYTKAAVRLSQESEVSFGVEDTTLSFDLQGGSIYAPYLIAGGTAKQVLNKAGSDDPAVFFNYTGANAASVDPIELLGQNQFAFDDFKRGGFRDFNDAVLKVDLQVA